MTESRVLFPGSSQRKESHRETLKKLGLALVLTVACILAAPAVPGNAPPDTQVEASPRKRKALDFYIGYLCLKRPCPRSDDECCRITEN